MENIGMDQEFEKFRFYILRCVNCDFNVILNLV